jgi:hypothetical protein
MFPTGSRASDWSGKFRGQALDNWKLNPGEGAMSHGRGQFPLLQLMAFGTLTAIHFNSIQSHT